MSVESRLASIQVGKAERHGTPNSDDPMERAWTTAFFKQPVQGPLQQGTVEAGQAVRLLGRPFPEWTVRRVFRLRVEPDSDPGALERVAGCEALSPGWRRQFAALGTRSRDGS